MDRKGRTIDLVQCLIQPSSVLLIVSPSRRKTLYSRLDQHIFFGDKVVCLSGPASSGLSMHLCTLYAFMYVSLVLGSVHG